MFNITSKTIILSTLIFILASITTINIILNNTFEAPMKATWSQLTTGAKQEVKCLADNIFYEAAYEPHDGKVAVAMVTLNRVISNHYEDTICGVVKEKIRGTCQFSWWCQDKERNAAITHDLTPRQKQVYDDILAIALNVYMNYGRLEDPTKGALFYHADYVRPNWKNLNVTTKIGRHIFYVKSDNFKKGDVRNGTNDAEIKSRFAEQGAVQPLVLLAYGGS